MLQKLDIKLSAQDILKNLPKFNTEHKDEEVFMCKTWMNDPTGDFFYDPWKLKSEWQTKELVQLFNTLGPVGEARIIVMKPGFTYLAHSDIDDRYHVTLQGEHSYLIDLVNTKMYPTVTDNCCYLMDTAHIHTAVNFGYLDRIQLVIRKLLERGQITNRTHVKIKAENPPYNSRYLFDNSFSVWLNKANKKKILDNFVTISQEEVSLDLEREYLQELKNISNNCGFAVQITHD